MKEEERVPGPANIRTMSSFILYSRYHFLHEFQAMLEILIAAHKIFSNFLNRLTLMEPTFTLVG